MTDLGKYFHKNAIYETHTNGYTKILTIRDIDELEPEIERSSKFSRDLYRMSIIENVLSSS